jgi:hypothetical protein
MSEASFASLNPALLARKGGAKPAMRPQLGPIPDAGDTANLEDLGWNDMGEDVAEATRPALQTADIVHLTPMIAGSAQDTLPQPIATTAGDRIVQDNQPDLIVPASKKKTTRRSALRRGKRAAFTLRLDAERHLKLRLASTMKGLSAQQVVTDALDALLAEIEDLDLLASKMIRQ